MQYCHMVAQLMFVQVFESQDGPDLGQDTLIACMAGQAHPVSTWIPLHEYSIPTLHLGKPSGGQGQGSWS